MHGEIFLLLYSYTTMETNIHILAFWPHPDDIDMGCGGTLYKTSLQGKHNIAIDLTPSQFSTRWDPELRQQEAQQAWKVLQLFHRENLLMNDLDIQDDKRHRDIIVHQIRKRKPEIIMLPNFSDRHPDHELGAQLIKSSIFIAGIEKYKIDWLQPHRPRLVLEYMIWDDFQPDLIIWLSQEEFDMKLKAFHAFESQIQTNQRADHYIKGRSMKLWWSIWKAHGEGFRLHQSTIWVDSFDTIYTRPF